MNRTCSEGMGGQGEKVCEIEKKRDKERKSMCKRKRKMYQNTNRETSRMREEREAHIQKKSEKKRAEKTEKG